MNDLDIKNVNMEIFESDNIDKYISEPENNKEILQECEKYDELDYPINLRKVESNNDSYWIAEHPDLPGCKTHGKTREKALFNLDDARKGWIYSKLCDGESIPQPRKKEDNIEKYSGRILLRIPRELHYKLIKKSQADGTSLNQEIVYLISYALGETSIQPKDCELSHLAAHVTNPFQTADSFSLFGSQAPSTAYTVFRNRRQIPNIGTTCVLGYLEEKDTNY